ncbi:unnamed protein product [Brachionus calyciflorus]|uniref:LLP n=1 Tax=Brachionus calyciflorus TaxID=104777 RepID=A0A813M7D9_9BILA|nr:unnamed protein product [Brachionus calyciflorus]
MAKSERKSKWKRKFRAIKREKNKKKELMMLNSIVEKRNEDAQKISEQSMVEETENQIVQQEGEENMQINDAKLFNARTKKDKNGNYPAWMNQRAIKKMKKTNNKNTNNNNNKNKRLRTKSKK